MEQFGADTLVENHRGLQQTGRSAAVKLFPSHVEVPADDPQVARVLLSKVRFGKDSAVRRLLIWVWSLGSGWTWIASSNEPWIVLPPVRSGRALQRRSRSTGCVRRAANGQSNDRCPTGIYLRELEDPPTPASMFRTSGHCLVAARFIRSRYVRRYTACPLVGARTAFTSTMEVRRFPARIAETRRCGRPH
jgi:hypothetical protein